MAEFVDGTEDDGFHATWMGKKIYVDVEAISAPPSLDFERLLQLALATEDKIWSSPSSCPDLPLGLNSEATPPIQANLTQINENRNSAASPIIPAKSSPPSCPPSCPDQPYSGLEPMLPSQADPTQIHEDQSSEALSSIPTKRSRQGSKNRARKFRRLEKAKEEGHTARPDVFRRFVLSSIPVPTNVDFAASPVKNGAYSAKAFRPSDPKKEYSVEELLKIGLTYVPWNGKVAKPYSDSKGRILTVMAGRPDDAAYLAAADAVYKLLAAEQESAAFSEHHLDHRRGHFPAVNVGVTHGQGTKKPVLLDNDKLNGTMDALLEDENVQRLATFASACFALWAPKVYRYYKDHLDRLFKAMPSLRRIFKKSVFPAAAFNFGPNVWTYKHKDVMNCPFGWCAIQALGKYDHRKGGHIILWELGLVIEFPPGSLILIPSACITHSNVRVRTEEGEVRASFTQYAAGALFRFVDYGFRTEVDLKEKDKALYEEMVRLKPSRWERGLELLTKIADFWPDTK